MNRDEHGKPAGDGREDSGTRWPWWGQFLLAVIALVTASRLLNCLEKNSNDGELWQAV